MEWVASTLHTTSEHGVSSITTADAHTSAARSRLNWRPRRFKWTRPFRPKDEIWFLRVCHHISNAEYHGHRKYNTGVRIPIRICYVVFGIFSTTSFFHGATASNVAYYASFFKVHKPHSIRHSSDRVINSSQRPLRTQHKNKHNRQTSMKSSGFELAIPATKRLQTHDLDRTDNFIP